MTKSLHIDQIDTLLKLLKSNVEKIDKRLNCDITKEAAEAKPVVKKKAPINKKTKYIFSVVSVVVLLVLFYFSIQRFDFSVNIPDFKNYFDGEALDEYDFVNF